MLSNFVKNIMEDYEVKGRLGKGAFGEVFEAYRKSDRLHCAIKQQLRDDMGTDEQKYLLRELEILAKVKHPNCLQLIAFSFVPKPIIVTPYMAHGTLEDALKSQFRPNPKYANFTTTKKMCSLYGICCAMSYLHSLSILHRDFKPANIFLNDDFEIVIADFGLSRSVQENINMTLNIGSPIFMAPELFTDDYDSLTNAIDVYAFGVTIHLYFIEKIDKLDDGKGKITSPQKLLFRIGKGARFVRPPEMPDAYWEIYQQCSTSSVGDRPSFKQLADQFETNSDLILEGTDITEYKAYIEKTKLETEKLMQPKEAQNKPECKLASLSSSLPSPSTKARKHKRY